MKAIWQNRERRTNAIVLTVFVWAPAWIILGVAAGPPALYAALTIAAAPFALIPFVAIGTGLYHGNLVGKLILVLFVICAVSVAYLMG